MYSLFWLLYISHLALKIFYPLKSIQLFNSDHSREIFIAEVLIICFIATAPSVVSIGMSNIGIVTFPPIQCGNSNRMYYFYTAVFPIMIVTCISGILMILTLHKLHMVSSYTLAKYIFGICYFINSLIEHPLDNCTIVNKFICTTSALTIIPMHRITKINLIARKRLKVIKPDWF